jgi:RNA polymerase sigma-70 factor (ECF subfamily)
MTDPAEIQLLINEVVRGNRDAFWGVVRTYSLPIRSYLASQLHHLDEVDDLAQEVFIAAYHGIGSYQRGENFGAWLRGIARHKLLNHFRSSTRRQDAIERFRHEVVNLIADDLEQGAAAERPEVIERLLHCVSQLPEKLRKVVHGGLEGEKPVALADALSTSVGAIYNLHYRANQMLRECMQREV